MVYSYNGTPYPSEHEATIDRHNIMEESHKHNIKKKKKASRKKKCQRQNNNTYHMNPSI